MPGARLRSFILLFSKEDLLLYIILGKEVFWICHGLELQGVAARVLEKHGPLLPWLPWSFRREISHNLYGVKSLRHADTALQAEDALERPCGHL